MQGSVNAISVLDKMRAQLQARGAKTIRGLGRTFKHFDSQDGNRKCDANEFLTGLQDIGVNVSKAECDALMGMLDTDGDGHINFDEFLVGEKDEKPPLFDLSPPFYLVFKPV